MNSITRFAFTFVVAIATFAACSSATDKPKTPTKKQKRADTARPQPAPQGNITLSPDSATIDTIMGQAVRNIAARYNLNEEQTKKTAEIMQREVYKFLEENEEAVWPIIRDLLTYQLGNVTPDDPKVVERIGKAAGPLMKKVEEAVLRGNEEWRMYLSPEQKRTHDYDMKEMDQTFQQLEANFETWAKGEPRPGPLFPPPPPPEQSPPRPRMPADGLPEPEIEVFRSSLFETFVEEFIKKYQLDKAQVEAARSILDEYRVKAKDFKNSKKNELKKIAHDLRRAHEEADRKLLREAEAARKQLLEPVYVLFREMNGRLTALLTTAQVQRFADAGGEAVRNPDKSPPHDGKTDDKPRSDSSTKRPAPKKAKSAQSASENDDAKDSG